MSMTLLEHTSGHIVLTPIHPRPVNIQPRFILLDFAGDNVAFSFHLPHQWECCLSLWYLITSHDDKVACLDMRIVEVLMHGSFEFDVIRLFHSSCMYIVSGSVDALHATRGLFEVDLLSESSLGNIVARQNSSPGILASLISAI